VIEVNTDPRLAPPTEDEIWEQDFNRIAAEIEGSLQVFAEDPIPMSMKGVGARFFWMSADERLHGYDVSSKHRVDYDVPIAPPDAFEVGTDAIFTSKYSDDTWQITAYALDEPDVLIDSITWPVKATGAEVDLLPMAIDEGSVYLLDPQDVLHPWRPGIEPPKPLFSLADRGLLPERVPLFSVHGDDVLVLEASSDPNVDFAVGTTLWHLKLNLDALDAGAAQKVAGSVTDLCFHEGGVLYRVLEQDMASALFSYTSSDRHTEDLSAVLRETRVDLGDLELSFDRLDEWEEVVSRFGCQPGGLTFENRFGSFAFDWKTRETRALHLIPIPDYDEGLSISITIINDTAVVEGVAFLEMQTCTADGLSSSTSLSCTPAAIYMRAVP